MRWILSDKVLFFLIEYLNIFICWYQVEMSICQIKNECLFIERNDFLLIRFFISMFSVCVIQWEMCIFLCASIMQQKFFSNRVKFKITLYCLILMIFENYITRNLVIKAYQHTVHIDRLIKSDLKHSLSWIFWMTALSSYIFRIHNNNLDILIK